MKKVVLVGYSGHALVVAEILHRMGREIAGYCDLEAQADNRLGIPFLGHEIGDAGLEYLRREDYFVAIGDNHRRHRVVRSLDERGIKKPLTIVHPDAVVATSSSIGVGCMIAPSAVVNPFATIGEGVICNSGCIIEHECRVGEFSHIAPGAVLAGNVSVGDHSFVGANTVVKEGVSIGADCTVGAGSVIIRNIPDGTKVVGNPGRIL
ncbi:MAG: acetyltransferase [Rhodothermales bacterium]|nr:acetyltransferase [Rhodothermales bacterium]